MVFAFSTFAALLMVFGVVSAILSVMFSYETGDRLYMLMAPAGALMEFISYKVFKFLDRRHDNEK